MNNGAFIPLLGIAWLSLSVAVGEAPSADNTEAKGFSLVEKDSEIQLSLDGQRIASYVYRHKEVLRPFLAHVKTPSGIQVTRNFPPVKGKDPTDHATMHPGIWLAFARVNEITFWHNTKGRIIHKGFEGPPRQGKSALFTVLNDYVAPNNEVICREKTTYRFVKDPAGYLITIDATLTAVKPVTFGVREEMGLGVRLAGPLLVKGGTGTILNSRGGRNESGTWGKVDKWWDYFGKSNGQEVGVMVMSGPGNPEVWSHSRDYGLLVANPFPVDVKKNRDKATVLAPGKTLRLRYGVLIHDKMGFERATAYRRFLATNK